jgi:hypothetical protein
MRVGLLAAAVAVVLTAGVTLVVADSLGSAAEATTLVPADAAIVVHARLDPSLGQKRALAQLLQKLPERAQQQVRQGIPNAVNGLLGEAGIDYAEDVEPWLGDEVALFLTGDLSAPDGAVLLQTSDAEAALAAVGQALAAEGADPQQESSYRDVTIWAVPVEPPAAEVDVTEMGYAVIGDFVAIGTPDGLTAAVDAHRDGGIVADDDYRRMVDPLTDDRLLTYWVDAPQIVQSAVEDIDEAQVFAESAFAFAPQQESAGAVFATAESVVFETVTRKPDDGPGFLPSESSVTLMGSLPAEAWVSAVIPAIGRNVVEILDEIPESADLEEVFSSSTGLDLRDDVLSWMQDGALFVSGEDVTELGGALVIESSDPAATTRTLDEVFRPGRGLDASVQPTQVGGMAGFELVDPAAPAHVVVLGGERLIVAVDGGKVNDEDSSAARLTGDGPTLADSEQFGRAVASLGGDYTPVFFLDVAGATQLIRSAFGASSLPTEFAEAQTYLEQVSHVVAGVRDDGQLISQRVVIGTAP